MSYFENKVENFFQNDSKNFLGKNETESKLKYPKLEFRIEAPISINLFDKKQMDK
ncbi:hypothetical protein LEP1GSC172_0447 [Leptospira noguchii]|uniref:Uncharacterized protein n=2 Tax=Leptospira noguchii TaxID=28182 RepID=T0FLK3_9LEPT|nr:hypothetical protein LEP1GSC172_0447 [Leptospira noguchii]EQA71019.1 hypothetical protein LEP1GSC059_3082 [Leptospira noguchii serovar Panama str. CZ214]